jgi:hypothetical protein
MECATPFAAVCPSCGATNLPAAKFCSECATPMAAGAPRTAAAGTALRTATQTVGPEAVAERRLVSVLFADLVGFTAYSEGRDAEDVRELQSRYFASVSEIIARYGGTIEKFIGDAVMALWGGANPPRGLCQAGVPGGLCKRPPHRRDPGGRRFGRLPSGQAPCMEIRGCRRR